MTQPWTLITRKGYDTQDNLASVTDPRSHTTQYVYDDFGRKNQTTSPDTGTTKHESEVNNKLNSDCIKGKGLKKSLQEKYSNLNIKCSSRKGCGSAWPILSNTITLKSGAFGKDCGPIGSTILHEMVHSCHHGGEKIPEACEASCFQYNPTGADPCNCK